MAITHFLAVKGGTYALAIDYSDDTGYPLVS